MTVKEYLEKHLANNYPGYKLYRDEPLTLWNRSSLLNDFFIPLESECIEKYKKRLRIRMDAILELEKIVKESVENEK